MSTMERLFSPCTRYRDIVESQGLNPPVALQELNLDLDVSTEEFLSAERAFTYMDLYAMLANESAAVWLTPHAAIAREEGSMEKSWGKLDESCRFRFKADGKVLSALAFSTEHLLEICDVVLRLLAASVVHSVLLDNFDSRHGLFINAPTLAHLMEHCQSLKVLKLLDLDCLDENHCHVLGTYSRPDLEIELIRCYLTSAGTSALAEVLERNQGPTSLTSCEMDYSVLADGLRGNSRLKSLTLHFSFRSSSEDDKRQVLAIASALRDNKGLVELNLSNRYRRLSDEMWGAICDSLKAHPTLEVLNLIMVYTPPTIPAVITSRIQSLLDMMKRNMSLHTIHLPDHYLDHALFRESVIPYLATNKHRPRVRAIQKTRPIPYRAKVLGQALLATSTNLNTFWMLISGNAEVAFPSRTTTITAATNLPTSVAAAATVDDTDVAASVMSSSTTTVTDAHPAATAAAATRAANPSTASASDAFASTPAVAANAATPSVVQKRKASP
mgnify:CR=1 FL=1